MKVLVCGGREYTDSVHAFRVLDELHTSAPFSLVIQGGARGADTLAAEWAGRRRVPCLTHWAEWDKHGKAAGHIRNAAMLKWEPEMVVAFPGGPGTESMVKLAEAAKVVVWRIM